MITITHKELLLKFERDIRRCVDANGKIAIGDFEREVNYFLHQLELDEKENTPVQKFIFVEDGSVDTDELIESLAQSNPEIKVVVYRQGGNRPEMVEVK